MALQLSASEIISVSLSLVSIAQGLQTVSKPVVVRECARLRRLIARQLAISDADVQQLLSALDDVDPQDLRHDLLAALQQFPLATSQRALDVYLVKAMQEQSKELAGLAAQVGALGARAVTPDFQDMALSLIMAQQTRRSATMCLGTIPIQSIYVAPAFKSVTTSETYQDIANITVGADELLALQAPYGHGKSTILRLWSTFFLPGSVLAPHRQDLSIIPLYFTAAEIVRHKKTSFWDALQEALREWTLIDFTEFFSRAHNVVYPVIMVDGLDEVADIHAANEVVEACLAAQQALGRHGRVVIAGRSFFFAGNHIVRRLEGARAGRFELLGFDQARQNEWLRKWGTIAPDFGIRPLTAADLSDAKGRRLEMYETPLVLLLHAVLNNETLSASNRVSIYQSVIDATVEGKALVGVASWRKKLVGNVDELARPPFPGHVPNKRRLLQEAAFIALKHGDKCAPQPALRRALANGVADDVGKDGSHSEQHFDSFSAEAWLRTLPIIHFFEQRAGGLYFLYQSFAEYLVAERYLRNDSEDGRMLPTMTVEVAEFVRDLAAARHQDCPLFCDKMRMPIEKQSKSGETLYAPEAWMPFLVRHCGDEQRESFLKWCNDSFDGQCAFHHPGRTYARQKWPRVFGSFSTLEQVTLDRIAWIGWKVRQPTVVALRNCKVIELQILGGTIERLLISNGSTLRDWEVSKAILGMTLQDSRVIGGAVKGSRIAVRRSRSTTIEHVEFAECGFSGDWSGVELRDCVFSACRPETPAQLGASVVRRRTVALENRDGTHKT